MKKIVMAMMMVGLVATSYGVVNVDWAAAGGFYFNADPFTGILGADNSGNSTIAQLMYSPDAIQDAGNLATGIGLDGAGYGAGNDVIWGTVTITANGNLFDGYALLAIQNETRAFTSGYVYAMIFQDNALALNDWYSYTPLMQLEDITGTMFAQAIQLNTDAVNGNAIDADPGVAGYGVAQVVPEPATFLLLGVGGIMSMILRRMRTA